MQKIKKKIYKKETKSKNKNNEEVHKRVQQKQNSKILNTKTTIIWAVIKTAGSLQPQSPWDQLHPRN